MYFVFVGKYGCIIGFEQNVQLSAAHGSLALDSSYLHWKE